ncbi:MAG: hypothetical protein QGG36_23980 [Pirellulaceae bacterium]|jgi:hypothetical protein|nr:hypothetical protein [Pirellulaceae bacterium]
MKRIACLVVIAASMAIGCGSDKPTTPENVPAPPTEDPVSTEEAPDSGLENPGEEPNQP